MSIHSKPGIVLRIAITILLISPGPCLSLAGEKYPESTTTRGAGALNLSGIGQRQTALCLVLNLQPGAKPTVPLQESIELPTPRYDSGISVERALAERRSVRQYSAEPVSLEEVSQLLWAAQGETDPRGFRTAPSAGALYPLEVFILSGNVNGLAPGIYRYASRKHALELIGKGDKRAELSRAALGQHSVSSAPAVLVICGVYGRTTAKYGQRGVTYVHMEAGHAAQNIFLQAVSLGLGTVVVGAFSNAGVKAALTVEENQEPLYIIPVGRMPAGE